MISRKGNSMTEYDLSYFLEQTKEAELNLLKTFCAQITKKVEKTEIEIEKEIYTIK